MIEDDKHAWRHTKTASADFETTGRRSEHYRVPLDSKTDIQDTVVSSDATNNGSAKMLYNLMWVNYESIIERCHA